MKFFAALPLLAASAAAFPLFGLRRFIEPSPSSSDISFPTLSLSGGGMGTFPTGTGCAVPTGTASGVIFATGTGCAASTGTSVPGTGMPIPLVSATALPPAPSSLMIKPRYVVSSVADEHRSATHHHHSSGFAPGPTGTAAPFPTGWF